MTEKNYNPQQKERKSMKKQEAIKNSPNAVASPKAKVVETVKKAEEKPTTIVKPLQSEKKQSETAKEELKAPEKKEVKKEVPKVKKMEVSARGTNLPISTKYAKFVCKFIVRKRIGDAIRDLEQVEVGRKAVPMKGEIPHQKGKGMMSGRFPKKAAKNFIILLKSLAANANEGSLDEPIIVEAMANMAARPYGRFGRTQKKRTHVKIIAKEKSKIKKKGSEKSQAQSAKNVERKEKKK